MPTVSNLASLDVITETWVDSVTTAINALDAWSSYTPTDSGPTVGNGTRTAAYTQIGKTVWFRWELVGGTTSSLSAGANSIGLPVAAKASLYQACSAYYLDSAVRHWVGVAVIGFSSASLATLFHTETGGSGSVGSGSPSAAWFGTAGDRLVISGVYEAA